MQMTGRIGSYKTSMQIDRGEGRPLEMEAIVGRPLRIARELGVKVRAYDPHAAARAAALGGPATGPSPALTLVPDVEHLAQDADALVLVTEWPEFRDLPFGELARRMRCPLIVDGRNSLDREQVTAGGLEYLGIGR